MTTNSNTPVVDVVEHESEYLIYLDMPGVRKEDLSIAVDRDTLTIKGDYQKDKEKPVYSYQEYRPKNYARSFKLSNDVDHKNINANLEEGVLTLTLQKAAESQPKQITIN